MAISPSASSRSSAPYSVPARSATRSPEIRLTSWMIPYPCCGPWASAVRIRNVVSCIARLLMESRGAATDQQDRPGDEEERRGEQPAALGELELPPAAGRL